MGWAFNDPGLLAKLEAADDATLDTAPFGVVAMAIDGKVTSYNAAESRLSGLSPECHRPTLLLRRRSLHQQLFGSPSV